MYIIYNKDTDEVLGQFRTMEEGAEALALLEMMGIQAEMIKEKEKKE